MAQNRGLTVYALLSLVVVLLLGVLLYALGGGFSTIKDDQLTVYCAAGILPPVEEAAKQYEKEYGTRVVFSTGNSGELREKVRLHGNADLYIPADKSYVEPLIDEEHVISARPVASFGLVIATQPGNPKGITTLDALLADDVDYAVCIPEAGAGKSTRSVLEAAGRWEEVWSGKKLAEGTVTEAVDHVKLGHLDAAIVWDAVARQRGLDVVEVPELSEGKSTITAAVLAASTKSAAAERFVGYLAAGSKGQQAFARHHYSPVRDSSARDQPYEREPKLRLHIGTVSEPAVKRTLDEFAEKHGVRIQTKYMGCGDLLSAMDAGDTPDAYLACDIAYKPRLEALKGDPELISKMDLVILVKPGNPKDIRSLEDLLRDDVVFHVSNPKNTAMGGLTETLFREAVGDWEDLTRHGMVIQSLNGHVMAAQLATGGGHDAAIAYAVNAEPYVERDELTVVPIDHAQANATQGLWKNKQSPHGPLIDALLQHLRSEMSGERYREAGFRFLEDEQQTADEL